MDFRAPSIDGRHDASGLGNPLSGECLRMSYWRWLLFAAMARLEVREDMYLGIPNTKTIPREVPLEIYPDARPKLSRIGRRRS